MQIHDNNKAKEQNKKEKMTHKSNPSKNKIKQENKCCCRGCCSFRVLICFDNK
jgi:hypothetical protein